jgi:hypothetical protein
MTTFTIVIASAAKQSTLLRKIRDRRKKMEIKPYKLIIVLSLVLAAALTTVSYYGAFIAATYDRDAPSMAAQGMGQDLVDLFFVVPVLLISLLLFIKENRIACFIFSGTVFYILYSFFIYSFGVHFNNLFLLYCCIAGVSLYLFLITLYQLNRMDVHHWFADKTPVRIIGLYLLIIAVLFYLLWLKDIVPAIINHSIPKSVSDYDLLVNPVHVLDIAFVLPGLIITAILLMKKQRFGYIFTPIFLVFIIILALALAGMVMMLKVKHISDDTSIAAIFIVLAVISLVFLLILLKHIKKSADAHA